MEENRDNKGNDKDKERKGRESIHQQPPKDKVKGIKTPEPPQVKDPQSLPGTDEGRQGAKED